MDETALVRASAVQREVDALAKLLGVDAARAGDVAWELEARGYSSLTRALQAIASANAAVARLREAASGARVTETVAYRLARAVDLLSDARARIAIVEAERLAAA